MSPGHVTWSHPHRPSQAGVRNCTQSCYLLIPRTPATFVLSLSRKLPFPKGKETVHRHARKPASPAGAGPLAPRSLARSLPGREAEEPAFTTPSTARWPPQRCAPPRPAPISPCPALPAPPALGRFFHCSRCPPPSQLGGSRTLFGHPEGARIERGSEPGRQRGASQRAEGRRGPRCELRSTPGERALALAAAAAQIPRRSVPPAGRPVSLGTMRLSAVATSAPLLVAALQVLFLLEAAASSPQDAAQTNKTTPGTLNATTNNTESHPNLTSSTTKPVTSPPSTKVSASTSKTTVKPQITTKSSPPGTNSTTVKPPATTKRTPPSTAAPSASKSSAAPTSNSTVTTIATLATATANINAQMRKVSRFDIGSFVGGIVLTLGVLSILYIGCKTYYSRGIRYRTIDEHDAII
ncbi:porimin [Notamacropus eugenii]|uniref:porimin n=1 Tax=Notamacropus eugenii TaxID=9315 RepID=UPI003B67C766